MTFLHRWQLRLRALRKRRQLDRDLEDELRFHLEMMNGTPAEARRQFGNVTRLKEACRDMWTLGTIESWWQDIRYGMRSLARSPGFTATAVTALALGIGANATVFTLVHAVLYKNLPFQDSEHVLYLGATQKGRPLFGMSYPDLRDLRAELKSFQSLGGYAWCHADVSDTADVPQNYLCANLTANAFSVIGQKPIRGRDFTADDERPGAPPVAILTHGLWERRYGSDPNILGKIIRIDGVPTEIIGVMPRGLRFPGEAELWRPLVPVGDWEQRENRSLSVFGRLRDGAGYRGAQAELATLAQRLAQAWPETNRDIGAALLSYNEVAINRNIRRMFKVLWGAVGFVLLIACANVANLVLSRAVVRSREISVRTAIGASRGRIIRQLLIESLLLAFVGGSAGCLLALWGIHAFDLAVTPMGKPAWIEFSIDRRVLLYLTAITAGTGIFFGMVPALRLSRLDVITALKEGARGAGAAIRTRWLSGVLVVVEVCLAVVLLAGAGLMIRSFLRVNQLPVGANTANMLTMRFNLPKTKYKTVASQQEFRRRVVERLRGLPGVEAVTTADRLPHGGSMNLGYEIDGTPLDDVRKAPHVGAVVIGAGYFRTMQARVIAGREFTDADEHAAAPLAIINQSFAGRTWPDQNPIGKRLRLAADDAPHPWLTVVGVAADILQGAGGLKDHGNTSDAEPLLYLPYAEMPLGGMYVAARTRVPPATLADPFRRTMQALDPDLPVLDLRTLEDYLREVHWPVRVFGIMFTIFAAIAFALAAVGLYAVVAHSVGQRTHEIGVRVALGATVAGVVKLVLATGLRQLAVGGLLGLAAAAAVTRLLSALLVGVSPTDPITFTAVLALLLAAGILGCAIPARRALRVDPAVTLRHE